MVSVAATLSHKSSPKQCKYGKWLCSNKILLTKAGDGQDLAHRLLFDDPWYKVPTRIDLPKHESEISNIKNGTGEAGVLSYELHFYESLSSGSGKGARRLETGLRVE